MQQHSASPQVIVEPAPRTADPLMRSLAAPLFGGHRRWGEKRPSKAQRAESAFGPLPLMQYDTGSEDFATDSDDEAGWWEGLRQA